jgi:hypothetical protein
MVGRAAAWLREPSAARRDRVGSMLSNSGMSFSEHKKRKVSERGRIKRKRNGDNCFLIKKTHDKPVVYIAFGPESFSPNNTTGKHVQST